MGETLGHHIGRKGLNCVAFGIAVILIEDAVKCLCRKK
jgi:hypothetical protein